MIFTEIIGIVGSSKVTEKQHYDYVRQLINSLPENRLIVTGDAKGIDLCVRLTCSEQNRSHSVIYSKSDDWESYKKRNRIIAQYCDKIISIALPYDHSPCYHCNSFEHDKTAGCYTGKINGNYEVKVLPTKLTESSTNEIGGNAE